MDPILLMKENLIKRTLHAIFRKDATIEHDTYTEFVRFCVVGAFSTILDASIFYVVIRFAPYQVALASGYCLSLIVNYILTIYWTFSSKPSASNAIGVVCAHLFNLLVVRMSLMWFFINIMSLSEEISYIPTLLISMITNFIIVKVVVNKLDK